MAEYMGSGSTGKAAILEGFQFIGIEQDPESYLTAMERIEEAEKSNRLPLNG
jgi:DNA modification methylase